MQSAERDELEKTLASLGTGSGLKLRPQLEPMAAQIAPDLQRMLEDSEYCEYLWQRFGKAFEGQKPQVELMGRIVDNFPPITRDSFEMSLKSWAQALLLTLPQAQEEPLKNLLHNFHRQQRREAVGTAYHPRTGKIERLPLSAQQERWMAYTEACADGDLEKVKAYVAEGVLVEQRGGEGAATSGLNTLVTSAYGDERFKVAEFLLQNGANIEADTHANRRLTLLNFSSSSGDLEMVRFLLQHGADVNGDVDLSWFEGYIEESEMSEEERNEERTRLADPNYVGDDQTPLIGAAMGGHEEIVKALIEAGANVNAWCDSRGTALDCAEPNVVELSKQHGAKYHYGEQTE